MKILIALYRRKFEMPEKEYSNPQNYDSRYFQMNQIFKSNLNIENHWSPYIEKELLVEIKSTTETRKKTQKSELKSLCLLAGVVGLLSIGMCVQADSIAQSLHKIARISIDQIIQQSK